MSEPRVDLVSVSLPARLWSWIDATMDNVMSDGAMSGDSEAALMGGKIRQAGWDQVPWVDGQWPSMNEVITIRLTSSEWLFAVDQLQRDAVIDDNLGDRQSVESDRAALDVVLAQLP